MRGGFFAKKSALPGRHQVEQYIFLSGGRVITAFSVRDEEMAGAFRDDADFCQGVPGQRGGAAGTGDAPRALDADTGHAEQQLIRRAVYFQREYVLVAKRPMAFRVEIRVQPSFRAVEQLL